MCLQSERTGNLYPASISYLTFLGLFGIIACMHGGCSSVAERQIVDLVVVGSNPTTHPFTSMFNYQTSIKKSGFLHNGKCACSSVG